VDYLYDEFQMNLVTAGALGALFGFMNIFSRASGGLLSDLAASRWVGKEGARQELIQTHGP
jgi:NNP family nitrate/nitrite transporter-like MFS transporter